MAVYKAYWIMGLPIFNCRGARSPFFVLSIIHNNINQSYYYHNYYVFKKTKQAVCGKICNFTGHRDHINKKKRNKGGILHLEIL